MSWEDHEPIKRPCPCGKGHYAVIERSDDWNRFDERWEMQCPACNAKYGLYARDYTRKGMVATYRGWVTRDVLRELAAAMAAVEEAREQLTSYAVAALGARWTVHFAGKAKKAVWRELTEDGKHYPSLGTFYKHVADSGMARVLERYFDPRELPTVIRILGPSASELSERMAEVARLEREMDAQDSRARQQAFS